MTRQNDGFGATTAHDAVIARRAAGAIAPMSFAQELLWLLDRSTPGLTAYNVPRAIEIRGALDVDALRRALSDVVERHEVLRTTYATGEQGPVQVVHPHREMALPLLDLSAMPAESRAAEIERIVLEEARCPFDLASDALLRARLVRTSREEHTLVLLSHHIASDGWSKGVLYRDLSAAYDARAAGAAPNFVPLAIQYADFAAWQRDAMRGAHLESHLSFWRERLAAPLPVLELPTDFARPAVQSFEGARQVLLLPAPLVAQLRELGMDHGATLYMVLLAAYQTVLHRYSGQDDVITGSPTAGRARPEVEGLIGYFANILAMRTSFAGDPTFGALLERIAEQAMDAFEHEDVPFEKLVLDLRQGQDAPGHAPLFRCVLTMEDTLPDQLRLGNAEVRPYTIDYGQAKFDITLLVAEQPDGLRLGLWYRTDLFTQGYAERFLGHLRAVLDAAVADASVPVARIPLLAAAERTELDAWNATCVNEGEPTTLVALLHDAATRAATRPAIVAPRASATAAGSVAGTLVLTYAELSARASQVARHLQSLGVGPNVPVGLLLDRSAHAMVGLVGILEAGGAYMPLSIEAPAARLAQQLSESGAKHVVTSVAFADRLPPSVQIVALDGGTDAVTLAALPDAPLGVAPSPEDLAYVLFTSGSTGVPKGVAVTHANAVHYARAVSRVLADVPSGVAGDGFAALESLRFGMASTLAADLGNTSLLPALLAGATLHVLGKDVTTEPSRFAEYVAVHQLDVVKATPNHVLALAAGKTGDELARVLPRKWLVLGGEALRPEVARTLLGAGTCRVLNHYGPTETTVGVLTHEVTSESLAAAAALGAQTVPLGRPLANTHAYVVDASGMEQPIGIPGELWLGGAGVSRGYLRRDDLTQQRFGSFQDERTYRTGDRVRRLSDGTLEFLGRTDDQVKVRGYRVELGEVEQALRGHPSVAQAVATLRGEELVAYAVPKQAGYAVSHSDRPTSVKLIEWLAAQLPEYMVPSAVVLLDALPLTANGKVDRAALPAPDALVASKSSLVAPRTETEATVARIWREVLKKDEIGVTDSFLDLGGHSLLAIRVLGRLSKELGVRLALRALFETPTVEKVAAIIDAELRVKEEARRQREADAAMQAALAAVEGLSDAEVTRLLSADVTGEGEA